METSASLLQRLRERPDERSWQRLDDLYRPLLRRWLQRDPSLTNDLDDLVQDVMTVLVREVPRFQRQRTGSFRHWLRTITVNRLKHYYRSRRRLPRLLGSALGTSNLAQLVDPASALSQRWDQEHDQHVLQRLLELLQGEYQPATVTAFRRLLFDQAAPAQVAAELGLSVNAVLIAKSRVLNRLRQEAQDFLE
jgi:RNA polymerase sigma-70 factor (ECF subfamily)